MGAELAASDPDLYDRYLDAADAAAGRPVRRASLEGPPEELTATDVAQPALFALSLALTEVVRGAGLVPDLVAGHSLGEYTAAVAAGALSYGDGLRMVCLRGRLMASVQATHPGAMAAVLGLSADVVVDLCRKVAGSEVLGVANLNSPSQVVVSGSSAAVDRLVDAARSAGAARALRLVVGAAFHSPLMAPVRHAMSEALPTVAWSDPQVAVAANASGRLVTSAVELAAALAEQVASPVRWVDCVRAAVAAGCNTFVEIGPGRVLSGLIRQIEPAAVVVSVDSPARIPTALATIQPKS